MSAGLLVQALDAGVTLFDTAALYGFGTDQALVVRVLKPHRKAARCSSPSARWSAAV